MQIWLTTRLYSPFTFEPSYHNFYQSFTIDTSNLWILGTMMRKPIKTTEYRKMPAVRGFYGFKRKTLWRRYRFSLPFFFFFSFYLSYMPPADELENIIKRGQFLCYFQRESRESKTQCLQFKMMQACRKKTSWIKNFSRSNTYVYARNIVIEILSFRFFFFFFFFSFSKFHIKIRLRGYGRNEREEISAML